MLLFSNFFFFFFSLFFFKKKEGADTTSPDFQAKLEHIIRLYVETESSQSIALSFKSKERLKRARTQPPDELKRAINQVQLEVEMLMVSEVKSFLDSAGATASSSALAPATSSVATDKSPRMPSVTPRAETRSDRSASEAVGPGEVLRSPPPSSRTPVTAAVPSASPGGSSSSGGSGLGSRLKESVQRSFSVSQNSPSKAAQRAVLKGTGNSGESLVATPDGSGALPKAGGGGGSSGSAVASSLSTTPSMVRQGSIVGPRQFDVVDSRVNSSRTTTDLTAYIWGDNVFGQLGQVAQLEQSLPNPTSLATAVPNVSFVQCTDSYTVLVTRTGQAFCAGKLSESNSFVPILDGHVVRQVGCGLQFCIALLDTGKIMYYGANRALEKLPLPELVSKIVCGGRHCLALTTTGKVYSWGSDEKKQLGHGLAERVPKPKHLAALSDVVDVAAGKNSSCCVSSSGVVTAWGAVVPKAELTVLEELRGKNIEKVACSDKFVVGVSDLGRVFVWHLDAVPDLGIPSVPNPVVALRSSSVFHVSCSDSYIMAVSDSGDVISWGEYGSFLGQGPRSNVRRYSEVPRRLAELQSGQVRRLSCSDLHVVACTGEGGSKREELVWDMFVRERSYCRSLYAIAEEYARRIKIKDTSVFVQAKVLLEHHSVLVRAFARLIDSSHKASQLDLGSLYASCLSVPEVTDVYRSWPTTMAVPLEKLSRPKLAGTLQELEAEVDAVCKKADSQFEESKSFSLVSLLREPLNYLSQCMMQLQVLRTLVSQEGGDVQSYDKALQSVSSSIGGSSSSTATAAIASATAAAPAGSGSISLSGSFSSRSHLSAGAVAEGATEEQMQSALRFRALKTELDIFHDANAQLVRYALALEDDLIQKTQLLEQAAASAVSERGAKLNRDLVALEEEMVEIVKENAELKARLKVMEIYKQAATVSETRTSDDPDARSSVSTPTQSSKARTTMTIRKGSGGVSASGGSGRNTMHSSSSKSEEQSEESFKEHEALRKRINPAAGRLLSEGEGSAARSLEQFTFDQQGQGAVYNGTELKAATLEKLLEHLTQSSGSLALDTFLISYRNFATPQDIFRRLVYMYCVAPPAKSKVVWLRLLNFLKSWVVKYFGDWEGDTQLRQELFSFLDEIVVPSFSSSTAVSTVNTIRERFNKVPITERQNSQRYLMPIRSAPAPAPNLLNYKPSVIAEQMTMSEHEIFRAITPGECFNQNWMKKTAGLSPNIIELISRFNKLSRWVGFELCSLQDIKDRKTMLEKLIVVATCCREVRSYGIVMAIMGALSSSAVFRLRKTWDSLPRASLSTYNELKDFVSSDLNFQNLREATKIAELPCFPYIGTFLQDLTFIDSGSQDFSSDGQGLINWSKFQATANTVLQLQAKQKTPYTFDVLPEWRGFLSNLPDHSENELFELSKKIEPSTNN